MQHLDNSHSRMASGAPMLNGHHHGATRERKNSSENQYPHTFQALMPASSEPREIPKLTGRVSPTSKSPTNSTFYMGSCFHGVVSKPTPSSHVYVPSTEPASEKKPFDIHALKERLDKGQLPLPEDIDYYFASLIDNEVEIGQFLSMMPKGGDIHCHVTGAIEADQWLDWAEELKLYADENFTFVSEEELTAHNNKIESLTKKIKELSSKKRNSNDLGKEKEDQTENIVELEKINDELKESRRELEELEKKSFLSAATIKHDRLLLTKYREKASLRLTKNGNNCLQEFFETFPIFESIERFVPLVWIIIYLIQDCYDENILYLEPSKGFEAIFKYDERKKFASLFPPLKLAREDTQTIDLTSMFKKENESLLNNFLNDRLEDIEEVVKRSLEVYTKRLDEADVAYERKDMKISNILSNKFLDVNERSIVMRLNVDINREQGFSDFFADVAVAFRLVQEELRNEKQRVVGIILSGKEDHATSLDQRSIQYKTLRWIRKNKISKEFLGLSIHAGELTDGIIHKRPMRNAISKAVYLAEADRIGHALCLKNQTNCEELLEYMKKNNIGIESCLTSNEKMLDVTNGSHSFITFLKNGNLVTINTDDPAVIGTNNTRERELAVARYKIPYSKLKDLERNHLRVGFMRGEEIFKPGIFEYLDEFAFCDNPKNQLSEAAEIKLASSLRARLQLALDRLFREFELKVAEKMKFWVDKKLGL